MLFTASTISTTPAVRLVPNIDVTPNWPKMQKFVVVKKYAVDRPEIQPEPAKVKMTGYLKKKRSKVGGWRKMWFVLQNHLLLSYPTKEEYDKGLGTFKDVLNLVPGTQIRPLGGFRFTIETTTNTIYTFRCDDSKTCTDWITALLESLSIKPDPKPKEPTVEKMPKFHTSLNDISEMRPKEVIRTSASCESIYQIQNDVPNTKSPKIPIAQNTARILERNGVPTKKMGKLQQIDEEIENPKRARNFRLHERSHSVNQSDEVFRINQMFRRSISTSVLNNRPGSSSRSGGSRSSSSASSPFEELSTSSRSKLITNALLVKQLQEHYNRIRSVNGDSTRSGVTPTTTTPNTTSTTAASSENNSLNSERKYKQCKNCCCKGHKRDLNQNNMMYADCERTLKDDMHRLSLDDRSAYDPTRNGDGNGTKNSTTSPCRRRQCTNHSPFHHQHHHCRHHHYGPDGGIDADAGVDADNEDVNGGGYLANGDARDGKMHNGGPRLSLSSDNVNRLEPIYAVVDLKNKYAHRAKMRQLEEQMERERPKSVHVVSSDYEEVLNFSHESEEDDEDDSENIYEPINIPETIQQRPTLWKYFPKFNIEALMEMARTRKKVAPGPISSLACSDHQIRNNNHIYNALGHQFAQQSQTNHNVHANGSTFSDIRKKFGHHRKSIKNRMRRFYWKDTTSTSTSTDSSGSTFLPATSTDRNAYSDDELDSQGATISNSETSEGSLKLQFDHVRYNDSKPFGKKCQQHAPSKSNASFVLHEIDKYRRGERHFFGSLSRLKKTRTSLYLDGDSSSRKNKHFALAAPKSSPCFHHELRNEFSRSAESKLDF